MIVSCSALYECDACGRGVLFHFRPMWFGTTPRGLHAVHGEHLCDPCFEKYTDWIQREAISDNEEENSPHLVQEWQTAEPQPRCNEQTEEFQDE